MTLDEATEVTWNPIRNLFDNAIDAIDSDEFYAHIEKIAKLGDIDEKTDAHIAAIGIKHQPDYEAYEKALLDLKRNYKGNVSELMNYRRVVPVLLHHIGELKLSIYAWRYLAEKFFESEDNTNKRWTDEDDNELIEMACNDVPEVIMSARFKRSPSAIKTRITYLVGVKRLSQKIAGKFIGTANGEKVTQDLEGTLYRK